MSTNDNSSEKSLTAAVALGFVLLLAVACAVGFAVTTKQEAIAIPLFVATTFFLLLFAVGLFIVFFSSLQLADKTQALGLPEGSIRALIALILMLLFAGVSLYLHFKLGTATKDSGQKEFANQFFTTISTLVTTVVGFYFGAGVAKSAQTTTATSEPKLTGVKPATGQSGLEVNLEITGSNLELVNEIRLESGTQAVIAKNVISNAGQAKGTVTLANEPRGPWDVVIRTSDGKTARLPGGFTVTEQAA